MKVARPMKPMTASFAIEIEYLTGVARAANDRRDGHDWPPQPDRLFSALVATWAARGERDEEKKALEWLERQPAPVILASEAFPRASVEVFVPPNDHELPAKDLESLRWFRALKTGFRGLSEKDRKWLQSEWRSSLGVIPMFQTNRQPRWFPACVPLDPVVRLVWPEPPSPPLIEALAALAHDTSYLGHSASLIRCTLRYGGPAANGRAARRVPYPGRLAELERAFNDQRRPSPGASRTPPPTPPPTAPASVFGAEWIVLAHAGGYRPGALAAPLACKVLLRTVQSGYGPGQAPSWVSGHDPDGTPTLSPHLAALPLLDAGWEWSQGRLMGLALVLPRDLEERVAKALDPQRAEADQDALAEEERFFAALGRINRGGAESLEIALHLPGGREWRLRREALPEAHSLRPERYASKAELWASVTPIALDRHPKADGEAESGIAEACRRIGLPRPVRVVLAQHSAIRGAPSIRGGSAQTWTRWRLPPPLAGRRLTHAVIAFETPVAGPVILGAGRFSGLGLCLPLTGQGST
jgi:CRISPR-associated protein Csb2